MDPDRRLYTFGDLAEELRDEGLKVWKMDVAEHETWRSAREKKLKSVRLEVQYTLTGVAWFYVHIEGKRSAWSRDYAWKCWVRPGDTFEVADTV